jgi:hypothetical protein
MPGFLEKLTGWFRGVEERVEDEVGGAEPVTTAGGGDRETSTNAQVAGASDEPYSGT